LELEFLIRNIHEMINMKTLVTYFSQTGNTKKVADAIYEAIEGEKEIKPVNEVESLEDYGIICLEFNKK